MDIILNQFLKLQQSHMLLTRAFDKQYNFSTDD